MLVAKSPFFATCLKDCWNGNTNKVQLKDEVPSAFEVLVDWLYTESLPSHLFQKLVVQIKTFVNTYKLAAVLIVEN